VHRSYLHALWPELEAGTVSALAHITGGGIPGNLPRSLPEGLGAEIDRGSWKVPPLFRALQQLGSVDEDEMLRVFNMGVGMVVVLPAAEAGSFVRRLAARGELAWELGRVAQGPGIRFQ
jgi:phosphoribosylformylglycinamidine cyclo-ligase